MKKKILGAGAIAALLVLSCAAAPKEKVRLAAVAGGFYPAQPAELTKMMDDYLARVPVQPTPQRLVALVAPHAGYVYSGPVAAYSYALLKGRKYERVVVIAPSHYEAFGYAAIYDGDAYATPLGNVSVDKEFAAKLAAGNPRLVRLSSSGHTPAGEQGEHALEVELPWLQHVLGSFKLVPVVMGDQRYESSRALGVALAKLAGPGTLIVASSDLSHFHTYDEASAMDRKTLNAISEWDYLSMSRNFERRIWEACGGGPIVAAMIAAERLGATQAAVLKYANTGDVTGDRSRVVGYGAVALLADTSSAKERPFALAANEKEELLKLARQSVETAVRQGKLYQGAAPKYEALLLDRGAFVTLKKNGELRGCIGYVAPISPLYQTVRDVAAYAAVRDTRFSPVKPAELRDLEYEVSVLSPMRRVLDVKQIQIGKHGLLVKKGSYEGVLLPQVPVEQRWDRQTFLEEICYKAGLPRNCTQDPDADLFLFTALVFGETTHAPVTPATPSFDSPSPQRPGQNLPPQ